MARFRVTAETTDTEILAPITAARKALGLAAAEAAVEVSTETHLIGERLVSLAQDVRNAEAVARAQMGYVNICARRPAERMMYLFDLAARSDDTWSGRGNDSARAAHDAVTKWASDEVDNLRYGTEEGN